MDIRGYLPTSLLEWPGKISAVVFVPGCNFRCPFCYNRDLVLHPEKLPKIPEKDVFEDLKKRKKWIDGAVLTGGEPLLQSDLSRFLSRCKRMGFETMLETNGSLPTILNSIVGKNLVDYLAMDFKTCFEDYKDTSKVSADFTLEVDRGKDNLIENIKRSMKLILTSGIDFEFRTTVVPGIHDRKVLIEMAKQLKKIAGKRKVKWFFQNFQPKNCLDPSFEKIKPYSKMEMEKFLRAVKKYIPETEIRGV